MKIIKTLSNENYKNSIADDLSMMHYLIAKQADINLKYNGDTPLMSAIMFGSDQAASLLIASGADITIKNTQKLDALSFAAKIGSTLFLSIIIKECSHSITEKIVNKATIQAKKFGTRYCSHSIFEKILNKNVIQSQKLTKIKINLKNKL